MPQAVRRRRDKVIAFSANNIVSESLSRGTIIRELWLRLQGTHTIAAGNNTVAKTELGDEWAIVKNIRIIVNGSTVLCNLSGRALSALQYFFLGNFPHLSSAAATGATQIGAGTADPVVDSVLVIPFWMPKAVKPMDTCLDARKISDITVEVQWGTFTDVNADSSAFTGGQITVYSLRAFNFPTDFLFSTWKRPTLIQPVTAANSALQIQLPVGDLYRALLLEVWETTGTVHARNIINNIKIKSGSTEFLDLPGSVLRQVGFGRGEFGRPQNDTITARYDPMRASADFDLDAYYWIDLLSDGRIAESIESATLSELFLELDVNAGTAPKIGVYPQIVVPVREAKPTVGTA